MTNAELLQQLQHKTTTFKYLFDAANKLCLHTLTHYFSRSWLGIRKRESSLYKSLNQAPAIKIS